VPPGFEAAVVFSNFGAVNCILEPARVFELARQVLADDGIVALTVMGRFCLFETLYSLARGRWRIAARRWRGISSFRAGGRAHPLRYYRPAELEAAAGGSRRMRGRRMPASCCRRTRCAAMPRRSRFCGGTRAAPPRISAIR
jgi:hypothetical protein